MASVTGAILAGGKSSRFGEQNKALADLGGKPLIEHVIDRLQPQVDDIIFSGDEYELENTNLNITPHWIPDLLSGQRGPLMGVLSCLDYLQGTDAEWLLTSACDTPFLPENLAEKLHSAAQQQGSKLSVADDGSRLQPANALWHRDLYPILKSAVENDGLQGFYQFLRQQPHSVATWDAVGNHFINLNTQLDLAQAKAMLRSHPKL